MQTTTLRKRLLPGAGLFLLLLCAGCGFHTIPPGSVGVKFNGATGLTEHLLRPQVVWVGWNQQLVIYPTNIQTVSYVQNANEGEKQGDDSIQACTKEGAILPVDVTVTYRIPADAESIRTIFNTFGVPDEDPDQPLHFIQREHIRWATIVAINDVSGKYSIFDLISKDRAQFSTQVKDVLAPILEKWGLHLEDVMIREVHPPQEIVDKITQQQQERAELQRIKILKQQAITEAQTTLIQAQQEAEMNRLLSNQGDQAIALKRLERRRVFIERWDGQAPLIGSGPIPQP